MTPGERWRWAQREIIRRQVELQDAQDAVEYAAMEWHYARFVFVSASAPCPTCNAPEGVYCAVVQRPDGTYSSGHAEVFQGGNRLIRLFLHPARTTTAEALEAAR